MPLARSPQARHQPLGRPAPRRPAQRHPSLQRPAPKGQRHQRKNARPDPAMAGRRRLRRTHLLPRRAAACRIPADAAGRGSRGEGGSAGRLDRGEVAGDSGGEEKACRDRERLA